MELEYSLDEGDVAAFLDYHSRHSAALQELRRSHMYGYAVLLAVFALIFWWFGETAVAIAFLVLGPIWAAWWPLRTRRIALRQAAAACGDAPGGAQAGRHVLRLDGDGLFLSGPGGQHRVPLSAVRQVVNLPERILIYVGPLQALIVPRRTSTGDATPLAAELERRMPARPSA